jgi:hypothetical protein
MEVAGIIVLFKAKGVVIRSILATGREIPQNEVYETTCVCVCVCVCVKVKKKNV